MTKKNRGKTKTMADRILVVEDEEAISELIEMNLTGGRL